MKYYDPEKMRALLDLYEGPIARELLAHAENALREIAALREVVRAADAMRNLADEDYVCDLYLLEAYDAARAKVTI